MASPITTNQLIDSVRSLIDERNQEAVNDVRDIIPALNRALSYGADILARKYEEPLLAYYNLTIVGGVQEYDIPEDSFEDRVLKIEFNLNGVYTEVKRILYRDITYYESPARTAVPLYYVIIGRKIRFVSAPNGTFNARIWYIRSPDPLNVSQGRITLVNTTSNYVLVDSAGSDLSTETDNLNSYVNLVDAQTGSVKASMQIQNINGNKLTFKSVPTRSSVQNKTILNTMVTADSSLQVSADDYVCLIGGSCVPPNFAQLQNFIVQHASAEMLRKLGADKGQEEQILQRFERQVERTWVGQEHTLRVSKRNRIWNLPYRRWFTRGGN